MIKVFPAASRERETACHGPGAQGQTGRPAYQAHRLASPAILRQLLDGAGHGFNGFCRRRETKAAVVVVGVVVLVVRDVVVVLGQVLPDEAWFWRACNKPGFT